MVDSKWSKSIHFKLKSNQICMNTMEIAQNQGQIKKMLAGKLFMRGQEMPIFLQFQSTCITWSPSYSMLKSPVISAQQWLRMFKVSCYDETLGLRPLWYYPSWDKQDTWWYKFLIFWGKRPRKRPMWQYKGWNYFLSLAKCVFS